MCIRNDGCYVCGLKLFFRLRGEGRGRKRGCVDGGAGEDCRGFGCGCGFGVARRGREGRGGRGGGPGVLRLLRG